MSTWPAHYGYWLLNFELIGRHWMRDLDINTTSDTTLKVYQVQQVLEYRDKGVQKFQKIPDNWIFMFTTEHLLTSNIGIFPEKSR